MAKYVMVVQSNAKPGRDADYNEWYDTIHFADICAIPGITGGRRFEHAMTAIGAPGQPYLSIFEIEADDPAQIMAEMGQRGADGRMRVSDALDPQSTAMWFYKLHAIGGG